tara:strand:- start:87 stop:938 length:852 start_codon:yes stop_codon:yes gene_type:complete
MSLQNLQSSNDIWKGSLLKNEAGKVGLVTQDFNEQLYIQSIYGTNGPVGCVTENNSTSSIRFSRCGNPGKSTEPADVPLPTKSTSTALDSDSPLYVTPGKSEVYGIKLSDAFNDAAYYEITSNINQGIGFSITDDYKVEVFLNKSVPDLQTYIVTVIPYNICREKADQSNYQSFEVKAHISPVPTATTVAIGTISVPSESFASSQDTLDVYFNNANNGYTIIVDSTPYNIDVTTQENRIYVINKEETVWGASIGATIEPNDEFENGIVSQSKSFTILLVESSE